MNSARSFLLTCPTRMVKTQSSPLAFANVRTSESIGIADRGRYCDERQDERGGHRHGLIVRINLGRSSSATIFLQPCLKLPNH